MSKDFYNILWIAKKANEAEIKKAYRRLAMKYHPDRNKWDKLAETKFKEINEAYGILSNPKKRKQYDMFWETSQSNQFSWWWFSWFEDLFWWWSSTQSSGAWWFNFEDLFWSFSWKRKESSNSFSSWWNTYKQTKKSETLDFDKIYEVPIFDLILGCKIEVRGVYWTTAKLKIPASTKPWMKFRVKWFWKKDWWKVWNLIIKIKALMPKNISDVDMQMLERIRENVGY